jgi:hypothetical protein
LRTNMRNRCALVHLIIIGAPRGTDAIEHEGDADGNEGKGDDEECGHEQDHLEKERYDEESDDESVQHEVRVVFGHILI